VDVETTRRREKQGLQLMAAVSRRAAQGCQGAELITYTLCMPRPRQALILIAVLLWQALSWATPFVVGEHAQRLAHLLIHEEVVDHHHHNDDSIHLQEADKDAVHLHADGGIQPVGLVVNLTVLVPPDLLASLPKTPNLCPPSVCLAGLLRPPQTVA
jgi:hypothetical protein